MAASDVGYEGGASHIQHVASSIHEKLQSMAAPGWLQVPWPKWMPFAEPAWVKALPGGTITGVLLLLVVLVLVYYFFKGFLHGCWRCMRKMENVDPLQVPILDSNSNDLESPKISPDEALKDCIGPKIILVLPPRYVCRCSCCLQSCICPSLCPSAGIRDEIERWLKNPKGVVAAPVTFGKKSPLFGHKVWAIGITEEHLKICAEKQKLRKKVRSEAMMKRLKEVRDVQDDVGFRATVSQLKDDILQFGLKNRIATWTEYKVSDHDIYEDCDMAGFKFTAHEVVKTIVGELCRATSHDNGYPIVLAAQEAGVIKCVFPIIHRESDMRSCANMLKTWKEWRFWREPPAEELSSTFGPSTALYFVFMHSYAIWLICPALLVTVSFIWHIFFSKVNSGISLGATFNEAWSQSLFSVVLSVWSTVFLANWRSSIHTSMHRLGQLTNMKFTSIDTAKMYFKSLNFKVSKRHGVKMHRMPTPKHRNDFLKHLFVAASILLLMVISLVVIFIMCAFSDRVAELNYFPDKSDWRNLLFQNILSVFVYMLVTLPLQGIYDRIIAWITINEGHRNASRLTEHIVRRRAAFQLLNYYCWFWYLGFYRQDWHSLRMQLATFFIVKPSGLGGALIDVLTPRCSRYETEEVGMKDKIEKEFAKSPPELFEEYLQIALVFGAATFFAPIFPEGLVIAFLHTVLEYAGDKMNLVRHQLAIPAQSQLYALQGWISVFDIIGWASIVCSSWLVFVFLEHLGKDVMATSCPHDTVYPFHVTLAKNVTCADSMWDDYVNWNPMSKRGTMFHVPGFRSVFWIVLAVEHILFVVKAYLALTIPLTSGEILQHEELSEEVLFDYNVLRAQNKGKKAH